MNVAIRPKIESDRYADEAMGEGIGSLLINTTIKKAGELDYRRIVLFGGPEYYHRFGFRNANEYGITTPDGGNFEAFMVLELSEHALARIYGRFYENRVFEVHETQLVEFGKIFPRK